MDGRRQGARHCGVGAAGAAAAVAALFLLALLVRLRFHAGFILGDDVEEFGLIRSLVEHGPSFEGHLRYRFPMWLLNYLAQLGLGNYEASFFLPTWLLSSLLPVIAHLTLRAAGYGVASSLFVGAFVALSPFEVLIGGVRANDLFVEFLLACSFWAFVRFERSPRTQGVAVALGLWLAFYAKLWSVFLLPVLGIYYLRRLGRERAWRGLAAFAGASLLLHLAACGFWRLTTGSWVPFLERLSATYPVPRDRLAAVLLEYPRHIWVGSEFGNTLFGVVPLLLLVGLVLAVLGPRVPALAARAPRIGLDRHEVWLLSSCLVFFALLELFPNNFTFDRYYSVPRIFRYLAPLSYGLSLLTAKLVVDQLPLLPRRFGLRPLAALAVLALLAAGILEAVAPGRSHRARVAEVREELRASCPPELVLDRWQGRLFRELHLWEACPRTTVRTPRDDLQAPDAEPWLRELEPRLANGAVLVTGLLQYVYYACHSCGFRLSLFADALDPRWSLGTELPPLPFDAAAEPVRLLRWSGEPDATSAAAPVAPLPAQQLFDRGIERFDAFDYPGTRAFMDALRERFPEHELCDDAAYFSAVTHWREQDPRRTIREFEALLARFPASRWTAAAHYHIGLAHRLAGRETAARAAFEATLRASTPADPERAYAREALDALHGPAPLAGFGRGLTEFVYWFQAAADRSARWLQPGSFAVSRR